MLAYATAIAMWDPSCVCDLHDSSQQHWILNLLSEARDWTCHLMFPSQTCFCCDMMGNPGIVFLISLSDSLFLPCRNTTDFFFFPFRATPMAYGSSQARGLIGAAAAGLHHSHSNVGSKFRQQPTPQLPLMPGP